MPTARETTGSTRTPAASLAAALLLCATCAIVHAAAEKPSYVWWEGEAAAEHNFSNQAFSVSWLKKKEGLSGENWLNNGGRRGKDEVYSTYRIDVPADGTYNFYTRKFWKHGPFKWRFDTGEWKTCGRDVGLLDSYEFQTHICANWVSLGSVDLKKGPHNFELRLLAKEGEDAAACFDCFVLTPGPFTPRGKMKPDQKSGLTAPGWWAFEPDPDAFGKDALLDLRDLNEKEAGARGFVKAAGDGFALGDGTPVRFWAVNCGPGIVQLAPKQIDYLGARLAKCGVNMVRFHGAIFDQNARDPAQVDAALLAKLHYFIAALKKQGIYTKLSFYFPLWFDVKPGYGLEGYDSIQNTKPFALLYFEPRMQQIYKSWAKTLLTTVNPHTKLAPGQDPGVAIVEVINEDSLFFWTFGEKNIPAAQMMKLEKQFGAWLAKRHGSLAKALGQWPGTKHKNDDAAGGHAGLFDAWHMTADGAGKGAPDKRARIGEQVRFLAETQRDFYAQTAKFFREECGAKNLVSASNWKTADERVLQPVERWTYAAGEVIDRHAYFGGKHSGPRASYAVSVGDTFSDRAAVLDPAAAPLGVVTTAGHPQIVSEIGWTMPNRLRADNALLLSAYGSLQGVDAYFLFAVNSPDWASDSPKFPVSVPSVLGQFPAAALQYRRGYIKEAAPVFEETLRPDDLFALKGSAAAEDQSLDALRAADAPGGGSSNGGAALDPRAFLVGRVVRHFDDAPAAPKTVDLQPYIDGGKKLIKSSTGELAWDYGMGLVTINAPKAQGVTGFLNKAASIDAADVSFSSKNGYGTLQAVSLDGHPLKSAKRILVQAFTEEQPYGWRVDDGGKILDLGGPPLNVKIVDARVTFKSSIVTATALDPHGYRRTELKVLLNPDGSVSVTLPPNALYVIVTR